MKRSVILVLMVAVLFVGYRVVASEEPTFSSQKLLEEQAAIIKPGVLPNSFWYWADVFAEQLQFVFTVGKEKKADFLLDVAEERLQEMKALSEKGITDYAEKLMTDHEDSFNKAKSMYDEVKEQTINEAKQLQENTEMGILKNEKVVDKELRNAPKTYEAKQKELWGKTMTWFRGVLSHLRWKKGDIQQKANELND